MRKYLVGVAAVLFPSVLLFSSDGEGFAVDWHNHVWMVGYFGEYIRQHHSFPTVANTGETGGLAFPVFYGYLFYPLLGLGATYLHPEIVVRLAAVLTVALQYVCVRKAMRRLRADEGLASGVACLTVWSIYALTNLYNRSALTEFFAVGVLTCAVCAWFDLLRSSARVEAWQHGLRFGLLLTLAVGFHPITGLYSLPLVVVLLLALLARTAPLGRVVLVCTVAGAASVAALAPWVYAVRQHQRELAISASTVEISQHPFVQPLDRWQTRLHPLPYDVRCAEAAPKEVSTPYLDSQVSLPLLILGGGLAVTLLRRGAGPGRLAGAAFVTIPLAYAATMLYLCLHVESFDSLPSAFKAVQFLYRIVSYVNLGFLLLPLFALLWAGRRPTDAPRVAVSPVLLCFALTYAGFCIALKLQHAEVARMPPDVVAQAYSARGQAYEPHAEHQRWVKNDTDRKAPACLPPSLGGYTTYGTPKYLAIITPEEALRTTNMPFEIETQGGYFGETRPLTVTMERPGFVATQILVFPWNRFEVDGRVISAEELRGWNGTGVCTAVPVPAGTHTIQYRFTPDRTWRRLHKFAQGTMLMWFTALAALAVVQFVRGRRRPPVTLIPVPAPSPVPAPLPRAA